jgi:hypothetical protein
MPHELVVPTPMQKLLQQQACSSEVMLRAAMSIILPDSPVYASINKKELMVL